MGEYFPGLLLLFVLSGFLVAASAEHSPGKSVFLWRRCIRLYPALWVAFGVSAVVVAIMTHLYDIHVSAGDLVKWIVAQVTVFQFYTPADLKAYGIGNPNGSLWMIPLQLCMYVPILLTYNTLKRWKMSWWLLAVYLFWVYGNRNLFHLEFGLYVNTFQGFLVSVLTIAAAYKFGRHGLRHDYSYSIYLYHVIFINVFLIVGFVASWWAIGAVYACTIIAAVLSCRLVEEPVSHWLKW